MEAFHSECASHHGGTKTDGVWQLLEARRKGGLWLGLKGVRPRGGFNAEHFVAGLIADEKLSIRAVNSFQSICFHSFHAWTHTIDGMSGLITQSKQQLVKPYLNLMLHYTTVSRSSFGSFVITPKLNEVKDLMYCYCNSHWVYMLCVCAWGRGCHFLNT